MSGKPKHKDVPSTDEEKRQRAWKIAAVVAWSSLGWIATLILVIVLAIAAVVTICVQIYDGFAGVSY